MPRPSLTVSDILACADEHHRRTGKFPTVESGIVRAKPDEKWANINSALREGLRGLPGGSSLSRLLAEKRGHRNHLSLPKYSYRQIIQWADAHCRKTGSWPNGESGPVHGAPGETWRAVEMALLKGLRGLPGGASIARLLSKYRGVRNRLATPPLSLDRILQWADQYRIRNGKWPHQNSGLIAGSHGETWKGVEMALRRGNRGLPGGSSIGKLLAQRRAKRYQPALPKLTVARILDWADGHRARTGNWPTSRSGQILDSHSETWAGIVHALQSRGRGLRIRGMTLPQLLLKHRGVQKKYIRRPPFSLEQILRWADAHKRRTGRWPKVNTGRIPDSDGETWLRVERAFERGVRGLPASLSLAKVLAMNRGA